MFVFTVPLHNACSFGHLEVIKVLLKHGADVNVKDNWSFTPLMEAATKGKTEACLLLLQHNACPLATNNDGKTAIDLADSHNVRLVLTGEYRKEELLEACRSGTKEILVSLLTPLNVNCHASDGRRSTPLHLSAGYNRIPAVEYLLSKGADVHAKDKGGLGKSGFAIDLGHVFIFVCYLVPLHNSCSYGHLEVSKMLIEHGSDVNSCDLWQYTPLHEAVIKKRHEVCSILLAHGADPFFRNCHGKAAVDICEDKQFQEKILKEYRGYQLMSYIGDAPEVSKVKKMINAEMIAFSCPLTGDTLLHRLMSCSVPCSKRQKQVLELLIRKNADLGVKNFEQKTPLHVAVESGLYESIEIMLKNGAPVDDVDKFGHTPEEYANETLAALFTRHRLTTSGTLEKTILEAARAGELDMVKAIIEKYPHLVNYRDIDGRQSTPLHFAAGYNRVAVVEYLISKGADVHAKDKGGLSEF